MIALFITAGLSFAATEHGTDVCIEVHGDAHVEGCLCDGKDQCRRAVQDRQGRLLDVERQRQGHLHRAKAKGKDEIAKADAEAAYENTPKNRENARVAVAQANYDVPSGKVRRPGRQTARTSASRKRKPSSSRARPMPRSTVSSPTRIRTR